MLRSVNGFGGLADTLPCSRTMRRGGLVAGLAIEVLEPLKAACKGSQTLSLNVGCFGCEAVTIPALRGKLPNTMQKERTVLRTADLANHFTGVLLLE